MGRRKLPAHLTAAVREYLRARVPLGTDAGAIMTEICLHARSPQIPDDRVGEVMQQMALSRLEIAYQAWRQGVDAGTAVGFLTEKVLAELRPQQRLRLEGRIRAAIARMGLVPAEAILLRKWMGFGASSLASHNGFTYAQIGRATGIDPATVPTVLRQARQSLDEPTRGLTTEERD